MKKKVIEKNELLDTNRILCQIWIITGLKDDTVAVYCLLVENKIKEQKNKVEYYLNFNVYNIIIITNNSDYAKEF